MSYWSDGLGSKAVLASSRRQTVSPSRVSRARYSADDYRVIVAHWMRPRWFSILYQFPRSQSRAMIAVGVGPATVAQLASTFPVRFHAGGAFPPGCHRTRARVALGSRDGEGN
jgi:hypothetical protein